MDAISSQSTQKLGRHESTHSNTLSSSPYSTPAKSLADTVADYGSLEQDFAENSPLAAYEREFQARASFGLMAKRALDIVSSGLGLVFLSPVLIVLALVIKLTSKGPVFFHQLRVGKCGKSFRMYKFRSMVVNAEELKQALEKMNEQEGPIFKIKRDPRITRIGRFIRKYSLDELPQLFNVLLGDMSLVGPRPALPKEVSKYNLFHKRRLAVRPGLTCIWQVSGRNKIGFEDWMKLDVKYIDTWSFLLDVKLLFKTIRVVVTGDGAY